MAEYLDQICILSVEEVFQKFFRTHSFLPGAVNPIDIDKHLGRWRHAAHSFGLQERAHGWAEAGNARTGVRERDGRVCERRDKVRAISAFLIPKPVRVSIEFSGAWEDPECDWYQGSPEKDASHDVEKAMDVQWVVFTADLCRVMSPSRRSQFDVVESVDRREDTWSL